MQMRVGCCGLAGLSLSKYAELFDTIEINGTFYKLPKRETAERWFESTKGKIVFCMKAFQGTTHTIESPTWKRAGTQKPEKMIENYGHLKPTKENAQSWKRTLEICMAMRASVCVIQLPPSFICTEATASDMLNFFKMVRRPVDIAIEFRRGSCTDNVELTKMLIENADLIHITDPLKDRSLNRKKIYYCRLHGLGKQLYRYNYTDKDLENLKNIILDIAYEKAYVMFNNLSMRNDALLFNEMIK